MLFFPGDFWVDTHGDVGSSRCISPPSFSGQIAPTASQPTALAAESDVLRAHWSCCRPRHLDLAMLYSSFPSLPPQFGRYQIQGNLTLSPPTSLHNFLPLLSSLQPRDVFSTDASATSASSSTLKPSLVAIRTSDHPFSAPSLLCQGPWSFPRSMSFIPRGCSYRNSSLGTALVPHR